MKYWEALKEMEAGKECIEINGLRYRIVVVDGIQIQQCFDDHRDFWVPPASSTTFLLNNEWKLYEEPGHPFAWAYEQMSQGRYVKRKSGTVIFKLIVNPSTGIRQFAYNTDRLCYVTPGLYEATDWVLYSD